MYRGVCMCGACDLHDPVIYSKGDMNDTCMVQS